MRPLSAPTMLLLRKRASPFLVRTTQNGISKVELSPAWHLRTRRILFWKRLDPAMVCALWYV